VSESEELVYTGASMVGASKERAIMEAFNHHFGRADWQESDVADLELSMDVEMSTGVEVFKINGRAMIHFGRMECHVEVETGMVQCLFRQSIRPMYGCCGVG